ncbi:hypothetical protein E3N88_40048 [Mikania micrantha]|uniref:Uncharacterized protein n=1 Tax=Mikania micrantha TaxID=192012 RepID=A0A5N6LMD3_9ASTR|nr:hypothetical protein E3N88_40038 [Mikania micrantha]KAD2393071.1 hypothetical protein E3N88_40048 [Mikania micrantha]
MWALVGLLGAWGWIHRLVEKGLGHGLNWMVSRSKGEYHNGVMKAANWASYVMIGWHIEWLSGLLWWLITRALLHIVGNSCRGKGMLRLTFLTGCGLTQVATAGKG